MKKTKKSRTTAEEKTAKAALLELSRRFDARMDAMQKRLDAQEKRADEIEAGKAEDR